MRALTQFQSDENSAARNDNTVLFPNRDSSRRPSKDPRVGCAGIVRWGAKILLGRRNKDPNRGLWVLPGGGVIFGESFEDTLRRELREEAGIEIDIDHFFKVYELIVPPDEHRVIVYLTANYQSGEPFASNDLSDVGFFGS